MAVWEIILLGAALAMDAVAVGMAVGMAEPKMHFGKAFETAGAFGLFQFFMPLVGYLAGSVFSSFVSSFVPALSFLILSFLGGKMIYECLKELFEKHRPHSFERGAAKRGGALKLLVQAFATSVDALAVGVTLLALEKSGSLALSPVHTALVIGAVTFVLSLASVLAGKKAGAYLADKAEILGGAVLILIGLKILMESV